MNHYKKRGAFKESFLTLLIVCVKTGLKNLYKTK